MRYNLTGVTSSLRTLQHIASNYVRYAPLKYQSKISIYRLQGGTLRREIR
jgi:hypothetical protein